MWKKIVVMFLVLVLFLSFTACGEELPPAQEIIDGVIESQGDIKSHKFDINMNLEITGEEEGEAVEMALAMDFSGAMDIENKDMSADMSISMEMTGEDEMAMAYEMYIVDDMGYIMVEYEEEEPRWMKEEVPEEVWEETSEILIPIESHLSLLELAEVSVVGSEKVKGVDCYVLELTPDLEQLWETVVQQAEASYMGLPYVDEEILQEAFTGFSVKQWVTKATYFLTKSEIDISMEMTPELMDFMGLEGTATMGINMTFLSYNHNQPISIVVPPEALEATESYVSDEVEAAQTELSNIQTAVIAMMVDNGLSTLPNPVTIATNDMGAFPDTSVCGVDKVQDRDGNAYVRGKDKDGYILYLHDINGDATSAGLVNYVAVKYTKGTYTVDSIGTVTQVTTGFE